MDAKTPKTIEKMNTDYPKFVWDKSDMELVHTNIPEEEREKLGGISKAFSVYFAEDTHVDMELLRAMRIRRLLETFLKREGRNPSDEFLAAATDFLMKNRGKFKVVHNPVREHWLFGFLRDICDGKISIDVLKTQNE